jgi:hypothetical protein
MPVRELIRTTRDLRSTRREVPGYRWRRAAEPVTKAGQGDRGERRAAGATRSTVMTAAPRGVAFWRQLLLVL